jgi:hypothetical protein
MNGKITFKCHIYGNRCKGPETLIYESHLIELSEETVSEQQKENLKSFIWPASFDNFGLILFSAHQV